VAAASNQPEGLRIVQYRVGWQERSHRELRISDEGETRWRKCACPELQLLFHFLDIQTAI